MANSLGTYNALHHGTVQLVAYAAAGGASAPSAAFGPATYAIRICATGAITATGGIRIAVGDGTPVASAASELLPLNWLEYILVNPGQKIAVLSNDTVTGSLSITELW